MIQQMLLLLMMYMLGWTASASILAETKHRSITPHVSMFAGGSIFSMILFPALFAQGIFQWGIDATFLLSVVAALGLTGLLAFNRRNAWRHFSRSDLFTSGLYLFLIAAATIFITRFNFATTTNDSQRYLELGEGLAVSGFMADGRIITTGLLTARPVFYSMFHALSRPLGIDYLWAVLPVYSIVFIPSFFFLLCRMLATVCGGRRTTRIFAGLASVILFTAPFLRVNMFYINTHMFTAIHFTLFFFLGWLALKQQVPASGHAALLVLLPAVLMRFENIILLPVFGVLFASLCPSGRQARPILFFSGLCVLVVSLCYLYVLPPEGGRFIASSTMFLTAPAGFLVMLFGMAADRIHPAARLWDDYGSVFPRAAVTAAALSVAALFIFQFETAGTAAPYMVLNLTNWRVWGLFGVLVLFILCYHAIIIRPPRFSFDSFLTAGMLLYVFFIISLAYLRGGSYRAGAGDSANRMLLHIAPVVTAYIAMAAAGYLCRSETEVPAGSSWAAFCDTGSDGE